jgi:hypothetical protein
MWLRAAGQVRGPCAWVRTSATTAGELGSWGWVIWLLGVAQGLTGVGILVKNQFARWLGVAFASGNTLAQMLMIQAYPLWSLALVGLDIVVIYALVVHGGRSYRPA